jgi:hypothetical protein
MKQSMNDIPILDPDTLSHAPVGDLLDLLIEHEDRVPRILFDACVTREQPKPGRNDPCPCGSGIKYKKCCLPADEAREALARQPH